MTTTADRFWAKVDRSGGPDACWPWLAYVAPHGYGLFGHRPRRGHRAHRFAYEQVVGPIPDGLTLDHLCRNKRCVNPAHLEAVTVRENTLRGDGPAAQNARKTHCLRGHELSGPNLALIGGNKRHCRTCRRAAQQRYEATRGKRVR